MSTKYPGNIVTSGAPAGYSVFFNANSSYLDAGSNAAFAFGTGAYTVEFWLYQTTAAASGSATPIVTCDASSGLLVWLDGTTLSLGYWGAGGQVTVSNALSTNVWTHIAISRSSTSSNQTSIFINGTRQANGTNSQNYTVNGPFRIAGSTQTTNSFRGYIGNVRVVKGTAVYDPTATSINVPTQLLNITNTSLLTCNSPAIVDQSSNAFSISSTGTVSVSTFTPFQGYVAYNPALGAATPGVWTITDALQAAQTRRWNMYDPYFNLTTLLLHGNGTNGEQNNTFLDSSSNNFTITRNGNTTQGTFSPFSQTGWSTYFPGSGAFLSYPGSASTYPSGTGDFTFESWIYIGDGSSGHSRILMSSNITNGLNIRLGPNNGTSFNGLSVGKTFVSDNEYCNYTFSYNTWYYVTIVRASAVYYFFVNGVQQTTVGSGTASYSFATSSTATIGQASGDTTETFVGYMSNLRLSNVARYTSGFTPSTTPLTALSGTQFLSLQNNRWVDNSSNASAISIGGGTPSVQAFSPFYPLVAYTPQAQGGSGYFDGSGDYLQIGSATGLDFGTGDFTIECWYYLTSTSNTDQTIIADGQSSYTSSSVIFKAYHSGLGSWPSFGIGSGQITVTANNNNALLNRWNHVAVARTGNTFRVFLNGAGGTSQTSTASVNLNGNSITRIGYNGAYDGNASYLIGNIAGLRVIKGSGGYDATQTTITVPTAPPTAITNTQLLANFTNAGIIDSTAKNVLETVGNAQISTTQSKFGGSSMYFDGNSTAGTGLVSYANTQWANFGTTGDFTVECWIRRPNITSWGVVVSFGRTFSAGARTMVLVEAGVPKIYYEGTTVAYTGTAMSNNTWAFVTWCRQSGTTYLGIDGNVQNIGTSGGSTNINANAYLGIGRNFDGYFEGQEMYVDDLRITKGYARYISNFTPPTSQWQDQ